MSLTIGASTISELTIGTTWSASFSERLFAVGQIGAFSLEPDFPTLGVYGVFQGFFVWATGTWWKASGGPALSKIKSKQKHCGDNTYNVVFTGHYKNGGKGTW